jgi:hypothetical protein
MHVEESGTDGLELSGRKPIREDLPSHALVPGGTGPELQKEGIEG